MGRPKGSKNKPKDATAEEVKIEIEVKQEEPKKDRKPRITKASKKKDDEDSYTVDEDTIEIRKKLDENTLDPYEVITSETIECEFQSLTQWMGLIPESSTETKAGRYSGSHFPIKGCNNLVWPVLAYINVDLDKYRGLGYSDKTIYAACINHLSSQTSGRKKKYGNLMPFCFSIKDSKIIATFITDDRKNKNFWSEGVMR
jgi:hypothetical protein